MNPNANLITYRILYEDSFGMSLCDEFFTIKGIDPNAKVKCNCNFNEGHESNCDIVTANNLLRKINNLK